MAMMRMAKGVNTPLNVSRNEPPLLSPFPRSRGQNVVSEKGHCRKVRKVLKRRYVLMMKVFR